jgi:hypothetical protein
VQPENEADKRNSHGGARLAKQAQKVGHLAQPFALLLA